MGPEKKLIKDQRIVGLIFLIVGVFIFLIGIDATPIELQDSEGPGWLISLVGVIFCVAAIMTILGEKSGFNNLLASVLIAMMGTVGAWVAIFGDDENISGGVSFVSPEANFMFARILFGVGAIICYAISFRTLRQHFKSRK